MKSTYIIGEIGQNHNGSVEIAKLLVDLVSRPIKEGFFHLGLRQMDAVKMTKRDLDEELARSEMAKPYNSPHSFGNTYLEHRRALELSNEQHYEVYLYAKGKGLEFIETICAIGALSILKLFTPNFLKVASRDLTNLPLLKAIAETRIPIIISTGMSGKTEIDEALETIAAYHQNVSILHCISQYPTNPQNVNLRSISYLREKYKNYRIGYSDHTIGISAPVAAVVLGAEIIEKHITLDRQMKGSDQAGSLGPDGVQRMVRDIRLMEMLLGKEDVFISDGALSAKQKLERSVATRRAIRMGETITEDDIHLLSPGDGVCWNERSKIIGKRAVSDISQDEIIYLHLVRE